MDILDVRAFTSVVEAGSMAQAASRLGVAKSIVSRRVSQLEKTLGAVMLTRTARGTSLTDAGRTYYMRAAAALAELEAAQEAVGELTTEISGQMRISVPLAFGEYCLAPLLADFAARHPKIQLEVCFEDRKVDLISEGYDLAVRIGNLPDSSLITRRLATVRAAVLASPAYLDTKGRPARPSELAGHDVIVYANASNQWRFEGPDGWEYVRVNPRLRTDNGQMMLAAARAGLGVILLPWFMAESPVERGELEHVLPQHPHEGGGLHLLMPPARAGIARVKALVAFLSDKFGRVI